MADYRRVFQDGYSYFITMVTYRRTPLLIAHIDLLRKSFALSKQTYDYRIDAIVILPDHLHMIITPQNAMMYPKIISHIKRSFVYGMNSDYRQEARMTLSPSSYRRQRSGIWQKRYYEHTIRNEKDMVEKLQYMYHNPVKHGYVDAPDGWVYSSFGRGGAVRAQHPTVGYRHL